MNVFYFVFSFDHGVNIVAKRLCIFFRAAKENYYIKSDGKKVQKTVNLDMKAYQTYAAFIQAEVKIKQLKFLLLPENTFLKKDRQKTALIIQKQMMQKTCHL